MWEYRKRGHSKRRIIVIKKRFNFEENSSKFLTVRTGRKQGLSLIFVALFAFFSCDTKITLEPPDLPIWNTMLTFPLIDGYYPVYDLLNDSTLDSASAGLLELRISEDLEPLAVNDSLFFIEVPTFSGVAPINFGADAVDSAIVDPSWIAFDALNFPFSSINRSYYEDAQYTIKFYAPQESELSPFPNLNPAVEKIRVESGNLYISAENYFPVTIRALDITFLDSDGEELGTVRVNHAIAPGVNVAGLEMPNSGYHSKSNELNASIQIIGQYLTDAMKWRITGTYDTSYDSVGVLKHYSLNPDDFADAMFNVSIWLTDVVASSAFYSEFESIESQGDTLVFPIESPIGSEFIRGHIENGSINFEIENQTPWDSPIYIEFRHITEQDIPTTDFLVVDAEIPSHRDSLLSVDLSDYWVYDRKDPNSVLDTMMMVFTTNFYKYEVIPPVEIFRTDHYLVQPTGTFVIDLDRIRANFWQEFQPISQKLDEFPVEFEGIHFKAAELRIFLQNQISVPTFLTLDLWGQNLTTGEIATHLMENSPLNYPQFSDELDDTNTTVIDTISDFLSIAPDSIVVQPIVNVEGSGEVLKNAQIMGAYEIVAPFEFALDEVSFKPDFPDTLRRFSASTRDMIEEVAISAILSTKITNSIPLEGDFQMLIWDSTKTIEESDTLIMIDLPQPTLAADGTVQIPGETDFISRDISDAFLDKIVVDTVNYHLIMPLIHFYGTENDTVSLRVNDYVRIESYLKFVLNGNYLVTGGKQNQE